MTATHTHDVCGAVRSQSGDGVNCWLFTGEQRDQVALSERLPLDPQYW